MRLMRGTRAARTRIRWAARGGDDVYFLKCSENSTIKSTVVRDDDGATDNDVANEDDEANAGDAGGADKDRVGGTGGW